MGAGRAAGPLPTSPRVSAVLSRFPALVAVACLLLLAAVSAACSKGEENFGEPTDDQKLPITIVSAPSPVRVGDSVDLVVQTGEGVDCTAAFAWPANEEQEPNRLAKVTAGPEGLAQWNWKVRDGTTPQRATITVECRRGRQIGTQSAQFDVVQ